MNRREIAHTWLEAVTCADYPYSLITIFDRGHLAIKVGGAVYLIRCAPVEVVPRSHKNCTEEIPALSNGRKYLSTLSAMSLKQLGHLFMEIKLHPPYTR